MRSPAEELPDRSHFGDTLTCSIHCSSFLLPPRPNRQDGNGEREPPTPADTSAVDDGVEPYFVAHIASQDSAMKHLLRASLIAFVGIGRGLDIGDECNPSPDARPVHARAFVMRRRRPSHAKTNTFILFLRSRRELFARGLLQVEPRHIAVVVEQEGIRLPAGRVRHRRRQRNVRPRCRGNGWRGNGRQRVLRGTEDVRSGAAGVQARVHQGRFVSRDVLTAS